MNVATLAAALALSLAATTPAIADESDSLAIRAANAVGLVIAAQGNAALVEIRREFKQAVVGQLKSLLPQAAPAAPAAKPVKH